MTILAFVLVGLVIGALACLILPPRESAGWVVSMMIGVAGSVLGASFGRVLDPSREHRSATFVACLLGAVLLTAAYHALSRRRATA